MKPAEAKSAIVDGADAITVSSSTNKTAESNSVALTKTKKEAVPGKKKSRWASAQEERQTEINGKSSSAASGSMSTMSPAATAADGKKKKGTSPNNKNNLYLSKFVQETSCLEKLEESTLMSRKNTNTTASRANSTQQPSASATSAKGKGGGKKRKLTDRCDSSSLSVNDSYYGPQPAQVNKKDASSVSPRKAPLLKVEGDVPLALNQALGSAKKGKKQKKKEAKKDPITNKGPSGFDANHTTLSERACRFKGKGGIHDATSTTSTVQNFEKYMGKTTIGGSKKHLDENDYERMTVKGTCQTLEKNYFRLTAPPCPSLVRPQPILEQVSGRGGT